MTLAHDGVWVANASDRTVSHLDPGSGDVTKINVGAAPLGISYGAGAVWTADSLDGTVTRISPDSKATHVIHVGGAPAALTVSDGRLWTTVLPGPSAHVGGVLRAVRPGTRQKGARSIQRCPPGSRNGRC